MITLNRAFHKRLFTLLVLLTIPLCLLGIYTIHTSTTLSFDSVFPSYSTKEELHKIEDIELAPDFYLRLPEFFFPKEEAKWWRKQESVYKALAAKDSVAVEYRDKDGVNRKIEAEIGYTPFIEVIKKTGLIYLAALIYLISAVIVFRRHRSESGLTLAYFFLSGSIYLIGSAPVVSRQIILIPLYFKILISLVHISAGGMITLVHFVFVFPRGKEIISKKPSLPYIILYGYFLLTTLLYLSRITAFGTTFPTLVFWIAAMLIAFSHSLIKEKDNFLRKQISLSLFAPLMAGSVFVLLHLLPGILGTTSMEFTYFALFSLILPYALPSAMDNLRLYQERLEMEKNSQKEKERIRQELHDNLANDLTSIKFLSEVA